MNFDPVASVIAIVSLGVSVWALLLAKISPLHQRVRATRDVAREAVTGALSLLRSVGESLAGSSKLPTDAESLTPLIDVIADHAPRLPERRVLEELSVQLADSRARWSSAQCMERRLSMHSLLEVNSHGGQPSSPQWFEKERVLEAERARTRLDLQETVSTTVRVIERYVMHLDEADRRGRDPQFREVAVREIIEPLREAG